MAPAPAAATRDPVLVKALYRSLLRVAHRFDAHPSIKLCLHINPPLGLSHWGLYQEGLAELLDGKLYLDPARASSVRLVALVRKYFRAPDSAPPSFSSRKRRGGGRAEDDLGEIGATDRVDAGFTALRELSKAWHACESHVLPYLHKRNMEEGTSDSSSSGGGGGRRRGRDEPSSSSSLSLPPVKPAKALGPGVVLLAHPMMGRDVMDVFARSVIYLVEHSKKEGAYGLILNKRSEQSLAQTVEGGLSADFFSAFSANVLRKGGPVPRLQMLHRHDGVGGVLLGPRGAGVASSSSSPPSDRPVYAGGDWKEATSLVLKGAAAAEEFTFFCGACTWSPGQLESEMMNGYWVPVAAPAALAVRSGAEKGMWEGVMGALNEAGGGGREGFAHAAALPEQAVEKVDALEF